MGRHRRRTPRWASAVIGIVSGSPVAQAGRTRPHSPPKNSGVSVIHPARMWNHRYQRSSLPARVACRRVPGARRRARSCGRGSPGPRLSPAPARRIRRAARGRPGAVGSSRRCGGPPDPPAGGARSPCRPSSRRGAQSRARWRRSPSPWRRAISASARGAATPRDRARSRRGGAPPHRRAAPCAPAPARATSPPPSVPTPRDRAPVASASACPPLYHAGPGAGQVPGSVENYVSGRTDAARPAGSLARPHPRPCARTVTDQRARFD